MKSSTSSILLSASPILPPTSGDQTEADSPSLCVRHTEIPAVIRRSAARDYTEQPPAVLPKTEQHTTIHQETESNTDD